MDGLQLSLPGIKITESVNEQVTQSRSAESFKSLGAYYTDAQVAEFLVWWAIRSPKERVLDPSFGGGVFLRAACKRLQHLRGDPSVQVLGVEIDERVHARIADKLCEEFGIRKCNLLRSNFFDLGPEAIGSISAVVGNPPFIRYHRFSGEVRRRALERAASQGVRLSALSSSWAPFLIPPFRSYAEAGAWRWSFPPKSVTLRTLVRC